MEKKKYYHYILVSYDDLEYDDNYWYRTDNKEIDIGDKVLVDRVGTSVIATVEDSGFYLEDEVPYPINKTK